MDNSDHHRIAAAMDELRERISDARRHTPGGELTPDEKRALQHSVERAHGLKPATLRRAET